MVRISNTEKEHIKKLYGINEQDMRAPLQTKPLQTNAGKYNKDGGYKPTQKDLSYFNYTGTFPNLKANNSQDWVEKASIYLLSQLELVKSQKGWGSVPCKPCQLSLSGSIIKDYDNGKTCLNTQLLSKKWVCPEGFSAYSVMTKEYGTVDWNKMKSQVDVLEKFEDSLSKFMSENKHEILMAASIGALFIPVIGPGLSLGIDLIDAGIYLAEGDKYSAGLSAVFALIPLGVIGKKIGMKIVPESVKSLLDKVGKKTTKPLTEYDKKILEGLNKNKNLFNRYTRLYGRKALINKLLSKKGSLKFITLVVRNLGKSSYNLSKIGLQIGGIYYTYDQLYNIMTKDSKKFASLESGYEKEKNKIDNQVGNQMAQSNISDDKLIGIETTSLEDWDY